MPFLKTCSYARISVWRQQNGERQSKDPLLQIAHLNHFLTFRRASVSKSPWIEWWNPKYRLVIQVLHGSRKTFKSRITKNNFLNSRFTEIKSVKRYAYTWLYVLNCEMPSFGQVLRFRWTDIIMHNEKIHWKRFLAWNFLRKNPHRDDSM